MQMVESQWRTILNTETGENKNEGRGETKQSNSAGNQKKSLSSLDAFIFQTTGVDDASAKGTWKEEGNLISALWVLPTDVR